MPLARAGDGEFVVLLGNIDRVVACAPGAGTAAARASGSAVAPGPEALQFPR